MRYSVIIYSLLFLFALIIVPLASAEIWVSNDSRDTWIEIRNKSNGEGSSSILKTGFDFASKNLFKSFIRFDLNQNFTNNTIIHEAKLELFLGFGPDGRNSTNQIRRVLDNWDENELTWNNQPSVSKQITDFVLLVKDENDVWISFNVTSDIQGFVNGEQDNFGWMIEEPVYNIINMGDTEAKYKSDEFGNSSVRPMLVIDYS